jgi:hypothetical protein
MTNRLAACRQILQSLPKLRRDEAVLSHGRSLVARQGLQIHQMRRQARQDSIEDGTASASFKPLAKRKKTQNGPVR